MAPRNFNTFSQAAEQRNALHSIWELNETLHPFSAAKFSISYIIRLLNFD